MRMKWFDRGITMRDDVIGEPDPEKREPVEDKQAEISAEEHRKQFESGEIFAVSRSAMEEFQAASLKRWERKVSQNPDESEPSEEKSPTVVVNQGGLTPFERAQRQATPDKSAIDKFVAASDAIRGRRPAVDMRGMSPIERFVAMSKARWAKK